MDFVIYIQTNVIVLSDQHFLYSLIFS